MRRGFNLLMAIAMLLILAGASVLTLKYVSISSKHYADSYIKEQAEIFAQSVLEATLLKIEGTQRSADCNSLPQTLYFNSAHNRFYATVNIRRYYLYKGEDNDGTDLSACSNVEAINTRESHGYAEIEMVVETNSSHPKISNFISPVRIVKRSLQRP